MKGIVASMLAAILVVCVGPSAHAGPKNTNPSKCGDGIVQTGESCDFGDLNGQTCQSVGFVAGTLECGARCQFNTSGCTDDRFVDNLDGTITDNETGLMWEKKDDDGGIHDLDDYYTWSATGTAPDGTAFSVFLGTLNNCSSSDASSVTGGFAGHCDWRLPTIVELQTILLAPYPCATLPCIASIFGPTKGAGYWSSTANSGDPSHLSMWAISFGLGDVGTGANKTDNEYVRAVRAAW